MPKEEPDPEVFGIMAEPSKQFLEAVRANQQDEQSEPELRRKRERRNTDLDAACGRRLDRNGPESERQEELLRDARGWAEAELAESVSDVQDVIELKRRIVKRAWDNFVPRHRYYCDFRLGYREFESALWEEGWPSLKERAIEAIQKRAALAATGTSNEAESGASVQALNGVKEEQEVPRAATVTVVFGSNRSVTVVHAAGTAPECRWDTRAGGDFKKYLLFHTQDRVKTGDEVHCELFDEPRIIVRVDPVLTQSGVSHWRATIMPRPLWSDRYGVPPAAPDHTNPHAESSSVQQVELAPDLGPKDTSTPTQTDSAPLDGPEPREGLDFSSEAGRDDAVEAYVKRWTTDKWTCSEASLARTAFVDPADLSKWKKGQLPRESDKKARIEKALRNNSLPTPPPRRDPEA